MAQRLTRTLIAPTALALALAAAPSAAAHDALTGTNPVPGSTVTQAPANITMTFSAPLLSGIGNQVNVKDPSGKLTPATPSIVGNQVSVPFTSAGDGAYAVTWRVTSSDGHPVSGTFSFTVKAGANGSTGSTTTTSASTTPAPTTAPASPTVKGPTTPTTDEPGDNHAGWIIGGAVLASGALAAAFVAARRRAKNPWR